MARLFAAVYLDEDVSVLVSQLLRSRGFHATTARDQQHLGWSDAEQLRHAVVVESLFLTHNRTDFEALHHRYLSRGQAHWGIAVATRRSPREIAESLLRVLNNLTADELENQLIYV